MNRIDILSVCINFLEDNRENIWWFPKNVVPLHRRLGDGKESYSGAIIKGGIQQKGESNDRMENICENSPRA